MLLAWETLRSVLAGCHWNSQHSGQGCTQQGLHEEDRSFPCSAYSVLGGETVHLFLVFLVPRAMLGADEVESDGCPVLELMETLHHH